MATEGETFLVYDPSDGDEKGKLSGKRTEKGLEAFLCPFSLFGSITSRRYRAEVMTELHSLTYSDRR
ncbi:hypothetical protein VN24_07420 [Paenibacillus beijingensis]|uniref:Uncharacterized protein n=1 Tax=Paenibacillus beijingensis TaxID=1126833 RepID=A0A0D5NHN2_9BACL|nr:hypothetical protein VN24_07420 [Paenibacillus beijingensis]